MPLTQQKSHAYQRLSGDLSSPTRLPPQNQQPGMSPSEGHDYDDYCPDPQVSKGQIDGFGLHPLTYLNERTGRDEGPE